MTVVRGWCCCFALTCCVAAMSAHALTPLPASTLILVGLKSRAVLCDAGEACVAGVCNADGTTPCGTAADCPHCLVVENEDLAMCRPLSLGSGTTTCDWSLFFDGSEAGLDAPVRALDVLPDGSLVLRAAADNGVPDIAGVDRTDLVRFLPKDERGRPIPMELPYRLGEWQLFFDGGAVANNSEGRLIEALSVLANSCRDVNDDGEIDYRECDLLFSPVAGGTLAGLPIEIEDLVRCRPTFLSEGGTIEACDYAIFYDASEVNDHVHGDGISQALPGSWTTGGTDAFAVVDYDATEHTATLLFSAGNTSSLPAHQPSRDLLTQVSRLGPSGACSGTPTRRCLGTTDCAAGERCEHDANPATYGDTVLAFDGSNALGGEMLAAIAILPDLDVDGVPDPIDNCREHANPGQCSSSGADCASSLDCPAGESCRQADDDGDGVGDPCDRCHGRDDAQCFCGDSITDRPSEQCDLGSREAGGYNGAPASPCTDDCRVLGRCTRSGLACVDAADCPAHAGGEGCCGNGNVESGDEACDDANGVDDDTCDNQCQESERPIPLPSECEGLIGPRIVPTFVRTLRFQKQRRVVPADTHADYYSKWSTRGEFSLVPGVRFDPDTQAAELIFNQGEAKCVGGAAAGERCTQATDCPAGRCSATLYRAALDPGWFAQAGRVGDRPRWTFADRSGTVHGAPAWTKGRFSQRLATIRRPLNEVKFVLQGRGDRLEPQLSLHLDPTAMGGPPTRVRQTIVIGDLCTTQTLSCEPNFAGTTLQCYSRVE